MPSEPEAPQAILERKAIEAPVVGTLKPSKPAPKRQEPKRKGLFARIAEFVTGDGIDDKKKQQRRKKSTQQSRSRKSQQPRRRSDSRRAADSGGGQRKKTQKKAPGKPGAAKKTKKTTKKESNWPYETSKS